MPVLSDFLNETTVTELNCTWVQYDVAFAGQNDIDALADCIAVCIMRARCGSINNYFQAWQDKAMNRRELTDIESQIIKTYIKPSLGLPGVNVPDDHVQAVIAECLWYELTHQRDGSHGLPVRVEAPHLHVTEPGGDGLVVYSTGDDNFTFRLWEIKKHSNSSSATSKITSASKQLHENGAEYLAKWSKVGQEIDHIQSGLSGFYATLVETWVSGSPSAMAGISVSKDNVSAISTNPVSIAKSHLPKLINDYQIEGLVVSIPSFSLLGAKVQEALWRGI